MNERITSFSLLNDKNWSASECFHRCSDVIKNLKFDIKRDCSTAKLIKVALDKPKRSKPSMKSMMGITSFNSKLCQKFPVDTGKTCVQEL